MREFDYKELVKATENFSSSKLIGKGSHGSVYEGRLEEINNRVVAIKKSSAGIDHVSNDNSKKLENEIRVLSSLNQSPHIIGCIGTSRDLDMNEVLVMEFMSNGSLHDLLHASSIPLSWPKRVEIAIQIARAVQFLHEGKPSVIHRDIKSANVLFDANWNAKLADFGLAVSRADSASHQPSPHQPAGTIGYLDPCYTTPSKLSTSNDVYSYGVILLEIISCRKAIDVSRMPASMVEWAKALVQKQRVMEICDTKTALPRFMEGTIRHMLHVASRCVSSKEEDRPSIRDILMGLDGSLVQRVNKAPSWRSFIGSVILLRRRRKLAKNSKHWQANALVHKCEVHSEISKGKFLLREILADVTLK